MSSEVISPLNKGGNCGEGSIDPQFIRGERDAGWPPRRPRGQGTQGGVGSATHKRLGITAQVCFGGERQMGNLLIPHTPRIETKSLEEALIIHGLTHGTHSL